MPVKVFKTIEEAAEQLYGICTSFVYVVSAVSSHRILDKDFHSLEFRIDLLFLIVEFGCSVKPACTSDKDLTFIFGIKVDQYLGVEKAGFECDCSVKAGLLRNGEKTFNPAEGHVAVQDCKFCCHSYSAICSERCVRGNHPAVFDYILDRVFPEIMFNTLVFLANHVRVALQDNTRKIFLAAGSLLDNQDITSLVCFALQVALCCKFLKISNNQFLMS